MPGKSDVVFNHPLILRRSVKEHHHPATIECVENPITNPTDSLSQFEESSAYSYSLTGSPPWGIR